VKILCYYGQCFMAASALCHFPLLSVAHETPPQSWPCRLVYISASLMFLILFIAYSAIFISLLTVHHYKMPFVGLQGLLDAGTYSLIVPDIPVYISFFKASNITLSYYCHVLVTRRGGLMCQLYLLKVCNPYPQITVKLSLN
jgi:hypothetical protein